MSGTEETSRKRKSLDINNDGPEPMVVEIAQNALINGTVSTSLNDKLEKEYGKEWKEENAHKIHMIPPTFIANKGTKHSPNGAEAERAMYEALQTLNDVSKASIIYHCSGRKMFGFVFHGQTFNGEEIDFIFITSSGLIIIECKGIQRRSNAQEKYEAAVVQLRRKIVSLDLPNDIPILKVVAFPLLARCDIEENDKTRVLFKDDLNNLKIWLQRVKFTQSNISFDGYVNIATQFLTVYHRNETSTKLRNFKQIKNRGISDTIDRLTFYTEEQAALMKSYHLQDMYITGAAGTGKTFALIERVKTLTKKYENEDKENEDNRKKILVIAYNVPITLDIESWVEEKANSKLVRVQTFSALLRHILLALPEETRVNLYKDADDADIVDYILNHNVLTKYFKSKFTKTVRYRHILVDEAQDLPGRWLELLYAMLNTKKKSDLWIFEDPFQNVRRNTSTPNIDVNFARHAFTKVVRNTRNVFEMYEHCHESLREEAKVPGALSEELPLPTVSHDVYGLYPECITAESNKQLMRNLVSAIEDLRRKGVSFNDIAVISHGGSENINEIKERLEVAGIKSNNAEEGTKMKHAKRKPDDPPIIVDSYQRFKGLESKILIFYIPPEDQWRPRDQDIYVGFSRAFCHLILMGSKKQINEIKRKEQDN